MAKITCGRTLPLDTIASLEERITLKVSAYWSCFMVLMAELYSVWMSKADFITDGRLERPEHF